MESKVIGALGKAWEPYVSTCAETYLIVTYADAVKLRGDWAQKEAGESSALLD